MNSLVSIRVINLLVLLSFLASCAQPIRRRQSRPQIKKTRTMDFQPIKKRVALLTFANEAPYGGKDLAVTATEEFRKELMGTGAFMIDREGSKLYGSSKDIYAGGGMNLTELARKAKMSGTNFIIYGRIVEARVRQRTDEVGFVRKTRSYAQTKMEIKVFDAYSAKEVYSGSAGAQVDDNSYRFFMNEDEENLRYRRNLLRFSARVAARKFIVPIMDMGVKLDWVGRVAKIISSKIYINAGRDSGIHIGDILKVVTEGSDIYDPETGAIIGRSKGEVKGTLEVIDFFGQDGSVAILHSGGTVTEGDFVQLY